jgi:hypothetical protein
MKPSGHRRKCLHCKELFFPDYRNAQWQRYCLKPECRQARKRASQQAWLAKPTNQDYFRDAQNAQRVRDWQKEHPGYWKHTARYQRRTLQDACPTQVAVAQPTVTEPPALTPPPAVPPPTLVEALPVVAAPPAIPLLPAVAAPAVAKALPAGPASPSRTLQDLCSMPIPMFVGLISMFIGSTLPDDIAISARCLLIKGHGILGMVPGLTVENLSHEQTSPQSGATPENPAPL